EASVPTVKMEADSAGFVPTIELPEPPQLARPKLAARLHKSTRNPPNRFDLLFIGNPFFDMNLMNVFWPEHPRTGRCRRNPGAGEKLRGKLPALGLRRLGRRWAKGAWAVVN